MTVRERKLLEVIYMGDIYYLSSDIYVGRYGSQSKFL